MKTFIEYRNGFGICFEASPETDVSFKDSQDFDSDYQYRKELKRIENGDTAYFQVCVTAERNGEVLGTAYLGCCYYNSVEEFYTTYHDDYFADLMQEAIEGALRVLENRLLESQLLNPLKEV